MTTHAKNYEPGACDEPRCVRAFGHRGAHLDCPGCQHGAHADGRCCRCDAPEHVFLNDGSGTP